MPHLLPTERILLKFDKVSTLPQVPPKVSYIQERLETRWKWWRRKVFGASDCLWIYHLFSWWKMYYSIAHISWNKKAYTISFFISVSVHGRISSYMWCITTAFKSKGGKKSEGRRYEWRGGEKLVTWTTGSELSKIGITNVHHNWMCFPMCVLNGLGKSEKSKFLEINPINSLKNKTAAEWLVHVWQRRSVDRLFFPQMPQRRKGRSPGYLFNWNSLVLSMTTLRDV